MTNETLSENVISKIADSNEEESSISTKSEDKKKDYLIEEYKILNNEIAQNSRDVFIILEVSLTASVAIIAVSLSEFVPLESQWLCLFLPWILLYFSTMSIIQRVKQTWILGRHIQFRHEDKLDFNWEKLNFKRKLLDQRKKKSRTSQFFTFAGSSTGIIQMVQIICIILSAASLLPLLNDTNVPDAFKVFAGITYSFLSLFVVVTVVFQRKKVIEVNRPQYYTYELYPEVEQIVSKYADLKKDLDEWKKRQAQ